MSTPPPPRPQSRRWLRLLLAMAAILVALFAALMASRPAAEDWLLRRVETALAAALVPTIHFDGAMHWQLQPVPTLGLKHIRLQHGEHRLLVVERVTLTLDAQALLDGNIVIDTIRITGAQLDLGDTPQHWLSASAWLHDSGTDKRSTPPITLRQLELEDGSVLVRLPEHHLALRLHNAQFALALEPTASASFEVSGHIEYSARPQSEQADLTASANLTWNAEQLTAEHIALSITPRPTAPGSLIPMLTLNASLQAWPAQARAEIALDGQLESSQFQGSIQWHEAQAYPFALQLRLDSLNLDEWMTRIPASEEANSTDLQPWRNWPVSADITVDSLHWQQVIARGARIRINTE